MRVSCSFSVCSFSVWVASTLSIQRMKNEGKEESTVGYREGSDTDTLVGMHKVVCTPACIFIFIFILKKKKKTKQPANQQVV